MLGEAAGAALLVEMMAAALDAATAADDEAASAKPLEDWALVVLLGVLPPNDSGGGFVVSVAALELAAPKENVPELAEPALATATTGSEDEGAAKVKPADEDAGVVAGAAALAPNDIDFATGVLADAGVLPKLKPVAVDAAELAAGVLDRLPASNAAAIGGVGAVDAAPNAAVELAIGAAPNTGVELAAAADDAPKLKPVDVVGADVLAPKAVAEGVVVAAVLAPKVNPEDAVTAVEAAGVDTSNVAAGVVTTALLAEPKEKPPALEAGAAPAPKRFAELEAGAVEVAGVPNIAGELAAAPKGVVVVFGLAPNTGVAAPGADPKGVAEAPNENAGLLSAAGVDAAGVDAAPNAGAAVGTEPKCVGVPKEAALLVVLNAGALLPNGVTFAPNAEVEDAPKAGADDAAGPNADVEDWPNAGAAAASKEEPEAGAEDAGGDPNRSPFTAKEEGFDAEPNSGPDAWGVPKNEAEDVGAVAGVEEPNKPADTDWPDGVPSIFPLD